jgi:hypothetical protein
MNLPPFRFDSFPPLFLGPSQVIGHPAAAEPHLTIRLPADLRDERLSDWENLWIDLGGEG